MITREISCCFTGRRPQNFSFGFSESHPDCIRIKAALKQEILQALQDGFTHFIGGMAMGADLWALETVLLLKAEYPHITVEAAIPYRGQATHWKPPMKARYDAILQQCDKRTLVSMYYTADCFHKRNRYMVDNAARLIAVSGGTRSGGTAYTMAYAEENGVPVIEIK